MSLHRNINRPTHVKRDDGSITDYQMFYSAGVKGLTDVDFAYERKGNFFFMEGKNLTDKDTSLDIPLAQALFFDRLACVMKDKVKILYVWYTTDKSKYYMMEEGCFWLASSIKEKAIEEGKTMKVKSFPIPRASFTQEQFVKLIALICEKMENE